MNVLESDQLVRELKRAQHFLVIVEGKKDVAALRSLGFSRVVALQNRPLYAVMESIAEKKVIILTDLDREGKKLYARLREGLQRRGVKVDDRLRKVLFRTDLRQIEGLDRYVGRLAVAQEW